MDESRVNHEEMLKPATKAELAFFMAEMSLVIREIVIAMHSIRRGQPEELGSSIADLNERAEKLWGQYEGIVLRGSDE